MRDVRTWPFPSSSASPFPSNVRTTDDLICNVPTLRIHSQEVESLMEAFHIEPPNLSPISSVAMFEYHIITWQPGYIRQEIRKSRNEPSSDNGYKCRSFCCVPACSPYIQSPSFCFGTKHVTSDSVSKLQVITQVPKLRTETAKEGRLKAGFPLALLSFL